MVPQPCTLPFAPRSRAIPGCRHHRLRGGLYRPQFAPTGSLRHRRHVQLRTSLCSRCMPSFLKNERHIDSEEECEHGTEQRPSTPLNNSLHFLAPRFSPRPKRRVRNVPTAVHREGSQRSFQETWPTPASRPRDVIEGALQRQKAWKIPLESSSRLSQTLENLASLSSPNEARDDRDVEKRKQE